MLSADRPRATGPSGSWDAMLRMYERSEPSAFELTSACRAVGHHKESCHCVLIAYAQEVYAIST